MANGRNCAACDELRNDAPNLIVNGITDTECASLMNNTGLNPASGNDDCTDLNNMNDCLIGNMADEVDLYDVCDWRDYMRKFADNVWTVFKAIICAICGLWIFVENLCKKLNETAYIGTLTLYASTRKTGSGSGNQAPAFDQNVRQGNMPTEALQVASDYKGIVVKNVTSIPLMVESTFTCSTSTQQHFQSCFIVITRDGKRVGQTPFITPDTYDQQVSAEPFILQPGESSTMRYYYRVGDANRWFQDTFGYKSGGSGEPKCVLDANNPSDPENQRSYFSVKCTGIVPTINC